MANNLRSLRNHRNENGTRMGSLSLRRFRRGRNAKRPTSPVRLFDVPNGKSGQDNAPQYLLRSQNAFRKLEQVHSCNICYNGWRLKNGNQYLLQWKLSIDFNCRFHLRIHRWCLQSGHPVFADVSPGFGSRNNFYKREKPFILNAVKQLKFYCLPVDGEVLYQGKSRRRCAQQTQLSLRPSQCLRSDLQALWFQVRKNNFLNSVKSNLEFCDNFLNDLNSVPDSRRLMLRPTSRSTLSRTRSAATTSSWIWRHSRTRNR